MLDLILDDAIIRTMDDDRPRARAVGIWQGRIVGFDDEVRGLNTRSRINLHGATVLPGLHDAHCHTAWYGMTLLDVSVEKLGTMDAVYSALEAAAKEKAPGEWVTATGFSQNDYDGQYPDIQVLDRIADGRPKIGRAHV